MSGKTMGKWRGLWIAAVAALAVLLIGAGWGLCAEGHGGGKSEAPAGEHGGGGEGEHGGGGEGGKKDEKKLVDEIVIEAMQVELAQPDRRRLRLAMQITLAHPIPKSEEKRYKARILDAAVLEFSGKTVDYLTMPESKIEMRSALIARVNKGVGQEILTDIYFPFFLIY